MKEHKAKGWAFEYDAFAHIPKDEGTHLMPKPEKAYSLDMEKQPRANDSMILQEAESSTVETSGSMKQN